jgi:hypothetical protein
LTVPVRRLSIIILFLLFIGLIGVGMLSPVRAVSTSPVLVENFVNNSFNHSVWQTEVVGSGPNITVSNDQLIITLPSNSTSTPLYASFGAALVNNCPLQGDFDMQIGFHLLSWPHNSGARSGLGSILILSGPGSVSSNQYAVERDSFAQANDFPHNESYLTQFQDGVQGFTPTNTLSGMLRLTRTGGTASGYYLNGGNWTLIHSGPVTTGEVGLSFGAWSDNTVFSHQFVEVAFDNFTLNTGQLVCPAITANPVSGPIGTQVIVTGANFPLPSSNYPGPSVEVTFDDLFLGTTVNRGGSFTFTLDVPTAQNGHHEIKAIDLSTGANATTPFQVTGGQSSLSLAITVGTVYFPRDRVVASVLVTSGGMPLSSSSLQLRLNLTNPDGTTLGLNVTALGSGLFRTSYLLPTTAQIGTYTITAAANAPSTGSSSSIASFEVKLPWLSSQGSTAAVAGIASAATAGVALVSWRKGYFRRSPQSQL